MWDVITGQELRRFQGHTNTIGTVAFAPNDRLILTSSEDETARLWHTQLVDAVSYLCSQLPRDFNPTSAPFEIRDQTPTCPQR